MPTTPGDGTSSPTKKSNNSNWSRSKRAVDLTNETISPGPKYNVRHMDRLGRESLSVTMPKAERTTLIDQVTSLSPGPVYNVKSQRITPLISFGKTKRFTEAELLLKEARATPGPGHNHVTDEGVRSTSPSFSFGSKLDDKRYFSDNLVYGHQGYSPGPKYNLDDSDNLLSTTPSFSFGAADRRDIYGIGYKAEEPGPGTYDPKPKEKESNSYTFGLSTRDEKKFFNDKLASHMIGDSSPGPKYFPDTTLVNEHAPSIGFGASERSQSFTPKRFVSLKMSQSDNFGRHSPGPAAYSAAPLRSSTAVSMKGRERESSDSINPQPRRARFISEALATENFGQFSPGPKYSIRSSVGTGSKFSFAKPGESYYNRPKTCPPRNYEKIYTGHGQNNASQMGTSSPGPLYDVSEKMTGIKPGPAFTFGKPKNQSPTKKEEPKKKKKVEKSSPGPIYFPGLRAVSRSSKAPEWSFGPKPTTKRGDALASASPGKDSPGPIYNPEYTAVYKNTPKCSLGGLA